MIEILPESTGNILGFKASGKLSDADYKQVLIPGLNAILAEHDKASMLMLAGEDFEGWELKAAWDDAKFGLAHQNDLDRVAMVGPPNWVAWGAKLGAHLVKCELKIFKADELEAAWHWIRG